MVSTLEVICEAGNLSFYGINANFTPYSYHTPPLRSVSAYTTYPQILESAIRKNLKYANLILYRISLTTAYPATYPMLDSDDPSINSMIAKQEYERDEVDAARLAVKAQREVEATATASMGRKRRPEVKRQSPHNRCKTVSGDHSDDNKVCIF